MRGVKIDEDGDRTYYGSFGLGVGLARCGTDGLGFEGLDVAQLRALVKRLRELALELETLERLGLSPPGAEKKDAD